MSISGNLEDVSVAEVLQFVHIGRRTGTLVITGSEGRGEVGFHRGRIISAWSAKAKKLGDLLLSRGMLERLQLEEALRLQESQRPRRSLGQILVESGLVKATELRKAVAEQIEETVYQMVTWRQGSFDFAIDELRPVDDIGVYPGDILPDINLNTQMLVLEALRIFDEKNRDEGESPEKEPKEGALSQETDALFTVPAGADESSPEMDRPAVDTEIDATLDRLQGPAHEGLAEEPGEDDHQEATSLALRVHLLTDNPALDSMLADPSLADVVEVARVKVVDAGLTLPGQSSPVVVADLRSGSIDSAEIANLLRSRPHASVVAVVDEDGQAAEAYAAGALSAVPAEEGALIACLRSVARERREILASELDPARRSAAFARLRRVIADLRSGLLSATVALNLMNVISESVERAIMFLVRDRRLAALGAFGYSMSGMPLAGLTSRLEVDLDSRNALSEAIDDGQTRSLSFDDAGLPEHFAQVVGRPRTGQVVIFPVLGSQQVISVIYTDNGPISREIEEIEILELAAAQVGVAFENELLRRRMAREKSDSGR
jgi:DNA-binding NarL/FixJ family response regulator